MATIHEMLRRVRQVDIAEIAVGIIADSKQDLVEKNKAQLLDQGIDKQGQKLKRYASNSYAARKNALNPFPGFGVPDLYRTGAFHRGFKLQLVSKNTFEINSSDSKTGDLVSKYGKDIFGLTTDSKAEYRKETMQPQLVREVKRIMKL